MVKPSGTARNAEVVAVYNKHATAESSVERCKIFPAKKSWVAQPKLMITTNKREQRAVTTRQHTTKVTTIGYKSALYPMEYWQGQTGAPHESTGHASTG